MASAANGLGPRDLLEINLSGGDADPVTCLGLWSKLPQIERAEFYSRLPDNVREKFSSDVSDTDLASRVASVLEELRPDAPLSNTNTSADTARLALSSFRGEDSFDASNVHKL